MKNRTIAVSVVVSLCWIARMAAQSPLFVSGSPLSFGRGVGYVGLVDLNRDGNLDLVAGLRDSGNPEVRLGDGRGRFTPLTGGLLNSRVDHGAIAFGDVNGDGIPDCGLASKDATNEYIHVFLGNGDGRSRPAPGLRHITNQSSKFYKPRLWFVDVNEDNKPDVVAHNGRRNTVEILLGDGRGGFTAARVVTLDAGHNVYTVAIADVDRDGHLDMAIGMSPLSTQDPGRVVIRRGDGSGGFSGPVGASLPVGPNPGLAALADVNGDARPDIVLSHGEHNLVSVLLNESNGRFSKPLSFSLEPGTSAFAVVVADANRDKKADLVVAAVNSVAKPSNSAIVVLLGSSNTFVPASGSPFRVAPGAYTFAAGDINEDGALDIVTSSFEGDAVTVLLGR